MIMLNRPVESDSSPEPAARYRPGQLVRHRRYGYRGVIVDFDPQCMADEAWYQTNQTQPDRDQPWYHVLVDGSTQTTYAAEQNLRPDPSRRPVHHPLLDYFFSAFVDGRYLRNDRAWPS